MPFPDLTSSGFQTGEDSSMFKEALNDPTISKDLEGGWKITRPRYTRKLPPSMTTGFTECTDFEKTLFVNFWNNRRGGSASFTYIHPVSGASILVRFAPNSTPDIAYVGIGPRKRWTISGIKLEPV
jgi:hypothetical protein